MEHPPAVAATAVDLEWARRRRVLNLALVLTCALTITMAVLGLVLPTPASIQIPALVRWSWTAIVAVWLIVALALHVMRRTVSASWVWLAWLIVTYGVAVYLLPGYQQAALALAPLPVSFAALLLQRRAVYLAAALTLLSLAVGIGLSYLLPPPALTGLPVVEAYALGVAPGQAAALNTFTWLWPALAVVATLTMAVLIAPLRGAYSTMLEALQGALQGRSESEAERTRLAHVAELATRRAAELDRAVEALIEQHGDGALTIDGTSRIVAVSERARMLWAEVTDGELVGRALDEVEQQLAGPGGRKLFDITALSAGARAGTSHTHLLHDRREEARLHRLRGELLELLTREMHTPLTSMLTALEMTLGQELPGAAERVLQGARRSSRRLLDLVTTLLEITELENQPDTLRRVPSAVRPIVESGVAHMAPLAQQGGVNVMVEYLGDAVVQLDVERVRRGFCYVLEYALRHSPTYSTVSVQTIRDDGAVLIRIIDQGAGLTPEQQRSLFDHVVTEDERDVPALGMTFSRLVLRAHGGDVTVESSVAQGCVYTLTLPVAEQ